MRPVNLLPQRYRPRTAGDGDPRTAYVALGVLVLLVLAMSGYVMAANKVSSRNNAIAEARQQIAAAQTQAVTFQEFGDFAAVKQARLDSVRSLATSRLDWERLFRELAHVLPDGVWLTGFNGQAVSGSTGTGGTEVAGQTLNIKGCAENHRQVADVMVRLRELNAAEDVELTKTMTGDEDGGGTTSGADGGSDGGCGKFFSFEIAVTLAPAGNGDDAEASVPANLGGGS